jgi:hypothetical protein
VGVGSTDALVIVISPALCHTTLLFALRRSDLFLLSADGSAKEKSSAMFSANHPVCLSYSAESAAIQQCFSLTTNQQIVLSAKINQRNEQAK